MSGGEMGEEQDQEKEEEEEEEEEQEEFYESLDRILSSSCSSTSASDDDADHRRRRNHPLRLPPGMALSYDAWTAAPASVEERRRSLLQQMGLSDDPALARRRSAPPPPPPRRQSLPDVARSASCDDMYGRPDLVDPAAAAAAPAIGRSRSEGLSEPSSARNGSAGFSKPPLAMAAKLRHEEQIDIDDDDDEAVRDPRLMIRNLDDGTEFVVREDGLWDRVKEVSTGRHLTMEEFEMCVGRSPIVQELMSRQSVARSMKDSGGGVGNGVQDSGKHRKRGGGGGWLRSIKNAAGSVVAGGSHRERRSSDEKDTSSEKGGRRSSSATDDSQDGPRHLPEKIKVRQYGKTHKELTALYLGQEIHAHNGSIWSIKFSLDGRFLASAGEDRVIHVWQVSEYARKEDLLDRGSDECGHANSFFKAISNGLPEHPLTPASAEGGNSTEKRRAKFLNSRKSLGSDHLMLPDRVFALSEKPICSFKGHQADVLDLSWSKSQYLLSSSMDKTVRLWHMSSTSCLKTFSHRDYVTCIQFNPVDDRYFISGSLDEKVRLWSVPDRQVVDWNDLHEMVTAVCYTPDGQGAFVGSHKGNCHSYDASENKLHLKCQVDLQNKKKRSSHKKITGFQFAPGNSSELLVTSADSRIRVVDGSELVHKFKGFRNTSSQISASFTTKGNYVVCASEDSHVYVWRCDTEPRHGRSRAAVPCTQSYEYFHSQDVTVAIPWPRHGHVEISRSASDHRSGAGGSSNPAGGSNGSVMLPPSRPDEADVPVGDRASATWPEENLSRTSSDRSPRVSGADLCDGDTPTEGRSALGLAIVTAGRGGDIRAYQNFGLRVRI